MTCFRSEDDVPMKLELEMKIDRNECVLVGVDIQSCVGGRATEKEREGVFFLQY